MNESVEIEFGGERLELHAHPGVYWPSQRTWFVADLHLGKDTSFRAAAIPVPVGPSGRTIERLRAALVARPTERVWVLGDLVHARTSRTATIRELLTGLFADHPDVHFSLVLGNHDRSARDWLAETGLEVVAPPVGCGPFALVHDVAEDLPPTDSRPALGGHLHPAVTLAVGGQRERLACFFRSGKTLTLPAMGAFTGTQRVRPSGDDAVYLVADQQVIPWIPGAGKQSRTEVGGFHAGGIGLNRRGDFPDSAV